MRIIHCTRKLLKEIDVPLVEPDKIPSPTEGLGNWYANLLRIDRRKCLLFTNEKSLYTFLIPKVLKATPTIEIFSIRFGMTHVKKQR